MSNKGSIGWCMVGGLVGSALRGLAGLDEAGGVEAGVGVLAVGEPVGNEPIPVLLAGQGTDCLGQSLEVLAGHVVSLPEAQPLVKGLGVVGGWVSLGRRCPKSRCRWRW